MGKSCAFLIDFKDSFSKEEELMLMNILTDLIENYNVDTFLLDMREKNGINRFNNIKTIKARVSKYFYFQSIIGRRNRNKGKFSF